MAISIPPALSHFRPFLLDGALWLFDRETGWNAVLEGEETRHLRMRSPRAVQFGITNRCNLRCSFCSRDTSAESTWTVTSAFRILSDLAEAGVLEVAFGGGEPFMFRDLETLLVRLWEETPLATNITTNGLLVSNEVLRRLEGRYGQIRLSLYDDNNWRTTVARFRKLRARFGINLLVHPRNLATLESTLLELAALGCPDALLLSYNGNATEMHLSELELQRMAVSIAHLRIALRGRMTIKLDVCWGNRLGTIPQILREDDCGAGKDFVTLSTHKKFSPCSFHHHEEAGSEAAEVLRAWRSSRDHAVATRKAGCLRAPTFRPALVKIRRKDIQ